ncbi:MAG: hypothetical protein IKS48_10530 [Eubacterium sp.]|nr:hypothetical protein [Eubacterium sp.]
MKELNDLEPELLGGLGEKVSNGGTQYYNQDRVYNSLSIAVAISTIMSFQPWYMVKEDGNRDKDSR